MKQLTGYERLELYEKTIRAAEAKYDDATVEAAFGVDYGDEYDDLDDEECA